MVVALRTRRTLHLPITLSVVLMVLNVTLMICWIVLLAQYTWWSALVVGTIVFALILVGLSFYMFLLIKEIRLNQRQANFVDSVSHELKSPIASLKLYLETLSLRQLSPEQQHSFFKTMSSELQRLDHLIDQLLEVGRLDAIGQQAEPEEILLDSLLKDCVQSVCAHHQVNEAEVFTLHLKPGRLKARPLVVETIFRNLLDNAVKYAGHPKRVIVELVAGERGRTLMIRISDNGEGVPLEHRKAVFRMFFRAGSELQRRQKGTGLGLYIVQELVKQLRGKVVLREPEAGSGAVFEVELPGQLALETPSASRLVSSQPVDSTARPAL